MHKSLFAVTIRLKIGLSMIVMLWSMVYLCLKIYEYQLMDGHNTHAIINIVFIGIANIALLGIAAGVGLGYRFLWKNYFYFFAAWFLFYEYYWPLTLTVELIDVFTQFDQSLVEQLFVLPISIGLYLYGYASSHIWDQQS